MAPSRLAAIVSGCFAGAIVVCIIHARVVMSTADERERELHALTASFSEKTTIEEAQAVFERKFGAKPKATFFDANVLPGPYVMHVPYLPVQHTWFGLFSHGTQATVYFDSSRRYVSAEIKTWHGGVP